MSKPLSKATLRSLEAGDVIFIDDFIEGQTKSKMTVYEVIEDAITGSVVFDDPDEIDDYGEIYEDNWKHIYGVIKNSELDRAENTMKRWAGIT